MRYTAAIALLAVGASANTIVIKRSMGGDAGPVQQDGPMGSTSENVKQICLEAHNTGRRAIGATDLQWDDDLASGSAGWADAGARSMTHSSGSGYGENLAMNSNKDYRHMILGQWFNECEEYKQAPGQFTSGTGHYTQCAWAQTTHVGCGVSADGEYLVCRYRPAGNMLGDFEGNVPTNCPSDFLELPVGDGTPKSGGSGHGTPATGGNPSTGGGSVPAGGYVPVSPATGGKSDNHRGSGGHRKPKDQKTRPKPAQDTDCDEDDNSGRRPRPQQPKVYKATSPTPNNNYRHKSGQSPTPKGNDYDGHSGNGGRPHGGQRPRPSSDDEDCDEDDQATRPRGGHRPSYRDGNQDSSPRPSNDYGFDSDRDESPRGGRGGFHGSDYDDSSSGSRHGGSDHSGSGKGDEDCDES